LNDQTAALARLVWDERRSAELAALGHQPSAAARVVRVDRGVVSLRTAMRDLRLATDRLDSELAVGDWVAVGGDGGIAAVLERRTLLERRMRDAYCRRTSPTSATRPRRPRSRRTSTSSSSRMRSTTHSRPGAWSASSSSPGRAVRCRWSC
jgi:hypothetical protein